MPSSTGPMSPGAGFLQLRINQQIAVVNNQYHQGNLGYFELPTGLELPDHGWHGGAQWGFRRSPAAVQNIVFERSPGPVAVVVPDLDEEDDRNPFDLIIEDLHHDIASIQSSAEDHEDCSATGDTDSDGYGGFTKVSSSSSTHYPVTPLNFSSSRLRQASTTSNTLHLPRPQPHLAFNPSDFISRFDPDSIPLPPRVNPDLATAPLFTSRGVFAPSTGTRPRRSKTHPTTSTTSSTSSRGNAHSTDSASTRTPASRHRSHSVLDPPRDLHHHVRTYTVTDPTTGEQLSLLDDDKYDPPTSYKLSDIRPEDRERAAALRKRRCTRCRRWRPNHRFQHKHNRCIFCQARIDAGVWLVGNQKRKRPETIEEEEEHVDVVLDEEDPRGALKRHHPGGGGFGGAGHAVAAC